MKNTTPSCLVLIAMALFTTCTSSEKLTEQKAVSVQDMISATAGRGKETYITVGTICNGKKSFTVYGADGFISEAKEYQYEIGSLTKTVTAALVAKLISENKIQLSDSIAKYLAFPTDKQYPTVLQLATHTAGYGNMLNAKIVTNSWFKRNPYYGSTYKEVEHFAKKNAMAQSEYPWSYSNFGFAVLSDVVSKSTGSSFRTVMENFVTSDLHLQHTRFGNGSGDLTGYWKWKEDDAYLAAGGLVSTISDMLEYASCYLSDENTYLTFATQPQKKINQAQGTLRVDEIGLAWIRDNEDNIVWHNGGTSSFNSYLGFNKEKGMAVVVLSNTAPAYRYSASAIGSALLKELIRKN